MVFGNHADGVTLSVKAVPNASKNEITLDREGRIVIRLTASPVDGRANKLLVTFLAKKLHTPPSSIFILHGQASRQKTLLFLGYDESTIRARFQTLI